MSDTHRTWEVSDNGNGLHVRWEDGTCAFAADYTTPETTALINAAHERLGIPK